MLRFSKLKYESNTTHNITAVKPILNDTQKAFGKTVPSSVMSQKEQHEKFDLVVNAVKRNDAVHDRCRSIQVLLYIKNTKYSTTVRIWLECWSHIIIRIQVFHCAWADDICTELSPFYFVYFDSLRSKTTGRVTDSLFSITEGKRRDKQTMTSRK